MELNLPRNSIAASAETLRRVQDRAFGVIISVEPNSCAALGAQWHPTSG